MRAKTAMVAALLGGASALSAHCLAAERTLATAIAPHSGRAMCSALTPEDFAGVGLPVTKLLEATADADSDSDDDDAYCVYAGDVARVEFDIFYPAGDTPADIESAEKTVLAEDGSKTHKPVQIPGVDDAWIGLAQATGPKGSPAASLSITVRKGKAVFDIDIPQSKSAEQQLQTLAQIVVRRIKE